MSVTYNIDWLPNNDSSNNGANWKYEEYIESIQVSYKEYDPKYPKAIYTVTDTYDYVDGNIELAGLGSEEHGASSARRITYKSLEDADPSSGIDNRIVTVTKIYDAYLESITHQMSIWSEASNVHWYFNTYDSTNNRVVLNDYTFYVDILTSTKETYKEWQAQDNKGIVTVNKYFDWIVDAKYLNVKQEIYKADRWKRTGPDDPLKGKDSNSPVTVVLDYQAIGVDQHLVDIDGDGTPDPTSKKYLYKRAGDGKIHYMTYNHDIPNDLNKLTSIKDYRKEWVPDEKGIVGYSEVFDRWNDASTLNAAYRVYKSLKNGIRDIATGKDVTKLVTVVEFYDIAGDRKSTRLNSSHTDISRMPSSA